MAWPKKLSVDKRIVSLLSASTYESFPRALREMVSNAYDADATRVDISIDQRRSVIEVTDNGSGMTPDEFDLFLRIAGRQRSRSRTTRLGRTRIGQFGIGFLAMFPFCHEVQVESTVEASPVVFRARIPASRFFHDSDRVEDVTAARVDGEEHEDRRLRERHYTKISLIKTSRLVERFLGSKLDRRQFQNSIRSWPGPERLAWELQDILPISLPHDSVIAQYVQPKEVKFRVTLNGKPLEANDYVEEVLAHSSRGGDTVGRVRLHYAIGTPWRGVHPDEARGLRVRLHGMGVGDRQSFDLNVQGRTFSRLHWLTGEVNIIAGLDEALTLDRDSFTATQDYDLFREFFREKLREQAFYVEDVDEARRKIKEQTAGSPRSKTESRRVVISEQVNRLKKRGFEVKERPVTSGDRRAGPVEIDTKRRQVTIHPDHQTLQDTLTVGGTSYKVVFGRWDYKDDRYKACRLVKQRTIELNQAYPLFSGAYKDVFRRLQVLLVRADADASSKRELFDRIQQLLLREFSSGE